VKLNDTDEKCRRIISIGGANTSALFAASRTCGAAGEWKRRVAEELSAVYFVGGWEEWPKSEGEPIDLELEDGNMSMPITTENYELIKECWARGCGCEQAANPKVKAILWSLLAICVGGIALDSFKVTKEKFLGGDKKDKKDKKEKKEKKDKKDKKDKKSKKGDDEVTGDESTETKSEKDTDDKSEKDTDDKSEKDTDGEGKDGKDTGDDSER